MKKLLAMATALLLGACVSAPVSSRGSALAELTRADRAYQRLERPTPAEEADYLRASDRLGAILCPNGMNDDDGEGDVSCDRKEAR
jgi:hypothetical protein